jgi:hypothetical protein
MENMEKLTTKLINGLSFTSWRSRDKKGKPTFYLAPTSIDLRIPKFGINPKSYIIDYVLLGQLDMVK